MNSSKTRGSSSIAFFFLHHINIKIIILNTLRIFHRRLTFPNSGINPWLHRFIRHGSNKTCAISAIQKRSLSLKLFLNNFNSSRRRSQFDLASLTNRYMSFSSLLIKLPRTARALNKHKSIVMWRYLLIFYLHASNGFRRPFERI